MKEKPNRPNWFCVKLKIKLIKTHWNSSGYNQTNLLRLNIFMEPPLHKFIWILFNKKFVKLTFSRTKKKKLGYFCGSIFSDFFYLLSVNTTWGWFMIEQKNGRLKKTGIALYPLALRYIFWMAVEKATSDHLLYFFPFW